MKSTAVLATGLALFAASCGSSAGTATSVDRSADAPRPDVLLPDDAPPDTSQLPDVAVRADGCPKVEPASGAGCPGPLTSYGFDGCFYYNTPPVAAGDLLTAADQCVCTAGSWSCTALASSAGCPATKPTPAFNPAVDPDAGVSVCYYLYPPAYVQRCTPCPATSVTDAGAGTCVPPWAAPGHWFCIHPGDLDAGA